LIERPAPDPRRFADVADVGGVESTLREHALGVVEDLALARL
jgi:hypothetical protein